MIDYSKYLANLSFNALIELSNKLINDIKNDEQLTKENYIKLEILISEFKNRSSKD